MTNHNRDLTPELLKRLRESESSEIGGAFLFVMALVVAAVLCLVVLS